MAEYLAAADLVAALGERRLLQRTDRDGDGRPDPSVLLAAIDRAEAALEAACRGRYALPLTRVDAETRGRLIDLAVYHLFRDRATDRMRADYEAALAWLDKVAAGRVRLAADPPPSGGAPARVVAAGDARDLTRDGLRRLL